MLGISARNVLHRGSDIFGCVHGIRGIERIIELVV